MNEPGFLSRLFLAMAVYFRVIFDARFAGQLLQLRAGAKLLPAGEEPEKTPEPRKEPPKPVMKEATPDAALQLLALLQREGRFVDFVQEDLGSASDAEVGAAARVVHDGCRKALAEHVPLEPVRTEDEGARVTLPKGFDAKLVRVTGRVSGEPPFSGTLQHRGWRAKEVTLPKLAEGHDVRVIAPAEVEL